ncbi:hypothetical protein [uncultured Umboniibacter sp.]|uniref:hypothetical protein n=1 Tax=uncultured Umboniibacter sp. TaxID=1798917 RepID=UPI00261546F2|nr:hypothetical protein [uncultured Umboniibacter sp.]
MKYKFFLILACFLSVSLAHGQESATKTVQITVNLAEANGEVRALRTVLCKQVKYRDRAICQELSVNSALTRSANLKSLDLVRESTLGLLGSSGTQSPEVDEQSNSTFAGALAQFREEAFVNEPAQRANLLMSLLSLQPRSALSIAQANNLFIDELKAKTQVTISII